MDLTTIATLVPALAPALPYLTAAVTVFAAVATVLPKPAAPTGAYASAYKLVNYIALNFGKARNA